MRKLLLLLMFGAGAFLLTGCNVFTVGTGGDYAGIQNVPHPNNGGPAPGDEVRLVSDINIPPYTHIEDWKNVFLNFNGYTADVNGQGDGLIFFRSDYNRIWAPRMVGVQGSSGDGSGIVFTTGSDWNWVHSGNIRNFEKGAVQGIPGRFNSPQSNYSSYGPFAVTGTTDSNGNPTTKHRNFNADAQAIGPSIVSFYQPRDPNYSTTPVPTNGRSYGYDAGWDWPGLDTASGVVYCHALVENLKLWDIDDSVYDGNGFIFDDWKQSQTSGSNPNYVSPVTTMNGCAVNIEGTYNNGADYGPNGSVGRHYLINGRPMSYVDVSGWCWSSDTSCRNNVTSQYGPPGS